MFSGEQRPKIRGTGEHRQFWGTGNIENQDFVLGEQGNSTPPPGRASLFIHSDNIPCKVIDDQRNYPFSD